MKSKEEIEQLATKHANLKPNFDRAEEEYYNSGTINAYESFIKGYTQCQEDIFNELNEWIVITLSAESKLGASDNVIEALLNVKYKIESLNKQN